MRPLYSLSIAIALGITTPAAAFPQNPLPSTMKKPRTVLASLKLVLPDAPKPAKASKPEGLPASRLCHALQRNAMGRDLPPLFFVRLIWQESRFNHKAVSRRGAQGIAQFMPPTARQWGLENPFDPSTSLKKSAELLAHLKDKFGNVGLAAAAYNAGPYRVQKWLAGKSTLPRETQHYVRVTTGRAANHWRDAVSDLNEAGIGDKPARALHYSYALEEFCLDLANSVLKSPWPNGAWNVRVAEDVSQAEALNQIAALRRKLGDNGDSKGGKKDRKKVRPLIDPINKAEANGAPRFAVDLALSSHSEAWEMCSQMRKEGKGCRILRS